MHASVARRASVAKARSVHPLLSSTATPLRSRSCITRSSVVDATHVRTLWWWGRHGSEWPHDDGLEERMRRYQKIVRYRYSKALRRRAMWDRDDRPQSLLGWRLPHRWLGGQWADHKNISSCQPLQADVHEHDKNRGGKDPWEQWHKQWNQNYESFRAAVDKAIDRDPYGTLFGRHLRSPMSSRNAGWTAWSWVFESKDVQEPKKQPGGGEDHPSRSPLEESLSKDSGPARAESTVKATFSVPPRGPTPATPKQKSTVAVEEDYEIDPISNKRVAKPTATPLKSEQSQKPFLSSLFSEHGTAVDIPVKTYKPHKVYGYGDPSTSTGGSSPKHEKTHTQTLEMKSEHSRMQELKSKKAAILGNSIDTAAEYGGRYTGEDAHWPTPERSVESSTPRAETPKAGDKAPELKRERTYKAEDNAPLFSGTTYQSKAERIVSPTPFKAGWLQQEGFREANNSSRSPSVTKAEVESVANEVRAMMGQTSSSSRLETALDRMTPKEKPSKQLLQKNLNESFDKAATVREEDIDLLRASDVRAAARYARKTKQDLEQAKKATRQRLESDFSGRQKLSEDLQAEDGTTKLKENLKTAWKHIAEYPQGVVARTMQSLGLYNSNFKNYVRLDKPLVNVNEKLVFKDETLSRTPSIYAKATKRSRQTLDTFTPSQEVIDADRQREARATALREANKEAKRSATRLQEQTTQLAQDIRAVYESEYGVIDDKHRQTPKPQQTPQNENALIEPSDVRKAHPLQSASVKPRAEMNAVVESFTKVFEPKIARYKDEAKEIRRNAHEIALTVKAMRSRRPRTYWNAKSTDDPQTAPVAEIGDAQKVAVSVDITQGSVESLRIDPGVTCLFMAYNPETDSVDIQGMLPGLAQKWPDQSQDMATILTNLKQPSKYMKYFAGLERQGFELVKGGPESLIFRKVDKAAETISNTADKANPVVALKTENSSVEAKIPETASEPLTAANKESKEAATVLEEIPEIVEPHPGPAAPTAPSPDPKSRIIRRQEQVFSGQRTQRGTQDNEERSSTTNGSADKERLREPDTAGHSGATTRDSLWTRFKRGVRRSVLTAMAMAGVAYAIGAAAESVGAQQPQRKLPDAKRPGRPGIYSTENSRW